MLIEPTLIHEAITSLGIETPAPDVTVARIETRVEKRVEVPVEIKPAFVGIKPAPVDRSSSPRLSR